VRPPPLPHQIDILQRVLDRVASFDPQTMRAPMVVFDLDATLFDNRPRTLQILMEYAEEVGAEYPDVAAALATLTPEVVDYLLSDTLRGVGITHADVVRDITAYWRDRFFADDYMRFDAPVEGGPEYVHACHAAGATIVYMTGRDIPGMLPGTVASLRDSGFPVGVAGIEMILKPDANLPDEAFKRTALPTLRRSGEVVAFFDNEPANCNLAQLGYPESLVVLIDTQRVPGAPDPDAGVEPISDFRLS
jgi:hypothetical protein